MEVKLNPQVKMTFKLIWVEIAQCRVPTTAIVKAFYEKKNVGARRDSSQVDFVMDELGFEGCPKAFYDGVIITVPCATHTGLDLIGRLPCLVGETGVLAPSI